MSTNAAPAKATTATLDVPVSTVQKALAGWLLGYGSANTRDAYARDLHKWLDFCAAADVDVFDARRAHVDGWTRTLEADGLAASTIARRIASVSSFYDYAADEDLIARNPAARVRRPKVSDVSSTTAPDRHELADMLASCRTGTEKALLLLLAVNGLRVSEAVGLDAADIATVDGHTVAHIVGKGGSVAQVPLPPRTVAVIESLGIEHGPLLRNVEGRRLSRHGAAYVVEACAKRAGIAKRITPHSLRHAAVTIALDAGVPLHRVQDMARHADPRTTRRYDAARQSLDGHAAYTLAGAIE